MEALAAEASLSRSAFHERFLEVLGMPPMQYLTHWRMQEASRRLPDSDAPVVEVALAVGYGSEAAFCGAFRRLTGSPPARWRRERRSAAAAPGATQGRNAARPATWADPAEP